MALSLLALLSFVTIGLVVAAVSLAIRDLVVGPAPASDSARAAVLPLRRLPLARHESVPRSAIGRFDQWFARLVLETGSEITPLTALLFLVFCGSLIGGAMFVWNESPLPATIGTLLGMVLAMMLLIYQRSRRIRLLQQQFPDALEMLARAVRAGESLDQAVQLIGDKSPEPLAIEFRRCARQLEMGLSMTAVMRALVYRLRLIEVRIFSSTLSVHRQAGGNLANTLERLAGVIRDRLNYRRQMRATTGAGRMSATLIAMTGPLLFTYMFFGQPQYIRGLIETPIGQSLLILAVFLELVGLIWIARMLRTDY